MIARFIMYESPPRNLTRALTNVIIDERFRASALAQLRHKLWRERFFRPARSRSAGVAALRQAECDTAGRKKIRAKAKDLLCQGTRSPAAAVGHGSRAYLYNTIVTFFYGGVKENRRRAGPKMPPRGIFSGGRLSFPPLCGGLEASAYPKGLAGTTPPSIWPWPASGESAPACASGAAGAGDA